MPTVLFIEDEPAIGACTKEYLEEFEEDYQVTWIDRGDTAYALLSQPSDTLAFDCIILDLTLPGKDGLDILKALRVWDKNTPVIVYSAVDVGDEKKDCLAAGATQFITKPFPLEKFPDLIEELIKIPEVA